MIGVSVGNYVIAEKIGEGGMGVVYRAAHRTLGRQVAIKVLHGDSHRAPELVSRFFNEAKAATEIRNDHIIDVLDFGQTPDGRPYIVMEWLEGQTLSVSLEGGRALEIPRAIVLLRDIGEALAAAHELGVVHRDLKPDNIFLQRKGNRPEFVKVLDFGIAKLLLSDGPADFKTRSGMLLGTPAYMSPEQCRGARDIDHRSDIYALGVIAYQMLTGKLPFSAEGLGELIYKHMSEAPPPPSTIQPSVGDGLSAAILKALAKDPADRYAHVEEFIEAMERGAGIAPLATDGFSGVVRTGSGPGAGTGPLPGHPQGPAAFAQTAREVSMAPGSTLAAPSSVPGRSQTFSTTLSPAEIVFRRPWTRHPAALISSLVLLGLVAVAGGWALRGTGKGASTGASSGSPATGAAANPRALETPPPAAVPAPAGAAGFPAAAPAAVSRPDAGTANERAGDLRLRERVPAAASPSPSTRPAGATGKTSLPGNRSTPARKGGVQDGPAVYRGKQLEIEREFP